MRTGIYFAKCTLDIPGFFTATAVLKGESVYVTEIFTDVDGVECADAWVNRVRLSVPMAYLQPAPNPDEPPHEELSASGGGVI